MRAVASSPMRVLPHGSFVGALGPSTSNTTFRVTPWMFRSPATVSTPFFLETRLDLKVSVGNFSTSKKSALFRCPSRCASPVLMVAESSETSTPDFVRSALSSFNVPVTPLNSPFTFEIIMCRTLNSAWEWTGSTFQVVAEVTSAAVAVVILNPPVIQMIVITNRFRKICHEFYPLLFQWLTVRFALVVGRLDIPDGGRSVCHEPGFGLSRSLRCRRE